MVRGGPDIYRLKFRLWTYLVKRHGCLPQPGRWIPLWGRVRAELITRALKEGREQVKDVEAEILTVPDKEKISISQTGAEPSVFKIPGSVAPRSHRKHQTSATENISPKENIHEKENSSSKENIPVEENISAKEKVSERKIIQSQSIVGRHLPGSVTVACVTACEKSSNLRQKVGRLSRY